MLATSVQNQTVPIPAAGTPVVIALVTCEGCEREYYSAAVPRIARPLPPCPECGARQVLADLIVGE